MTAPAAFLAVRCLLPCLALLGGAGCSALGSVTGAAAGVTSSIVSSNPAVGVAVGVGVRAGTDALVKTVLRRMSRTDQDNLARVAGALPLGEQTSWQSRHFLHFGDQRGQVRVVREIVTPFAQCREILFSLSKSDRPRTTDPWFITQTCLRQDGAWKWAAAEPAVERWGNLQ